ncbi:MAG: ABC transporter permease [Terracidiphilus sp.]|nr:ABC transporter permease [Terracidiphilus sp.]
MNLWPGNKRDREIERELCADLELEEEEQRENGASAEEAHYAALRALGNPTLLREQTRAVWSWNRVETLLGDLRYCLRGLRKSPGFTVIAIAVMALGIGANVALFAVIRSVLLNPLPYHEPQRLLALYSTYGPDTKNRFMPIDAGSFFAWKSGAGKAAEMAMISPFQNYNVSAESGQLPEKADTAWVTANFFFTLGVEPQLGRSFAESDDRPEAGATAILSYSFWMRRYGGDAKVLGRKIWLDSRPYTIIGVMPESMAFFGPFSSGKIQVWMPAAHESPRWLMTTFEDHEFIGIARLAPGVSTAQLMSTLDSVQAHIKAEHPGPAVRSMVSGRSLLDDAVLEYKTPLYVLFGATACVLLIACLNVASLLVARTATRRRELAIRTALGGGRMRLIRERVLESLVLATAGGGLGVLLAIGAIRWLLTARPDIPRVDSIHIDLTVALFALSAMVVCALFSGLVSALSVDSRRLLTMLREGSRGQNGGRVRARLRRALLMIEVSLTVVLLIGAGLLLKSYDRLRSTDLGVPIANTLTLGISLPEARYKTAVEQVDFLERVLAQVRVIPGVQSAGLVSRAPGQGWGGDRLVNVVEHLPLPAGKGIDMMVRGADPGYFAAIHLPILRGRTFAADERLKRDHVALISTAAAKVCFPGEDPIGKHLKTNMGGEVFEIIGVVGDTRYSASEEPNPMMYMPILGNGYNSVTIVVRAAHDVNALAMPVEKVIGQLDPDLPVSDVSTLEESVARSSLGSQFNSVLVLGFAVIALVLAAVGHYGVLAYLVTQRTSEIGIRIALGAQRMSVLRRVLLDGLRPAVLGLVAGLVASALLARMLRSILYETEPLDLPVFATVAAVLLCVTLMACLAPAWRAARLDPMTALRTE